MTLYLVFNANLQQIIMDWKSEEEKIILKIIRGGWILYNFRREKPLRS